MELLTEHARRAEARDSASTRPIEVMLGVPANANSNQRFLTVEAFRRAGFRGARAPERAVGGAPSSSVTARSSTARLLVYDLGGGTFDASVVDLDDETHTVVASEGIGTLGGDDFDRLLAEMAVGEASLARAVRAASSSGCSKSAGARRRRSIRTRGRSSVDLDHVREGWGQVTIPVAAYYERCRPLVGRDDPRRRRPCSRSSRWRRST